LDAEVFSRTASRFATKRGALDPRAMQSLTADILRRLAEAAPREPLFDAAEPDARAVEAFCEALIDPGPDAALRFVEDRRAEGATRREILVGYVPAAARRLGEGWDEDRLSLADVTIGTGHLFAVMRALRAEVPAAPHRPEDRRALFATVPGEDHGLGVTLAADLFREAGWEIDLRIGADHDALSHAAERTRPRVIGLSLSTERRLEALARLVVALRFVVPGAVIGVAPASRVDAERLHEIADIDLVLRDVPSALLELDRLVRGRV
jgi:methanogenic corrinoid protein MtbC1